MYSRTFEYKKNPQCPICGTEPMTYKLDPKTTFKNLYEKILRDPELKLKNPSISADDKALFLSNKQVRQQYEENYPKTIDSLFEDNSTLHITDASVLYQKSVKIKVIFEEGAVYVPPIED